MCLYPILSEINNGGLSKLHVNHSRTLRKNEHVAVSSAWASINLEIYWITISTTFLQHDHSGCGLEELQSDTSGKHHSWQGCSRHHKLGRKCWSRAIIQQDKEIPPNNNLFFWITFLEWSVRGRNWWRRLFSDSITLHYQRQPEKDPMQKALEVREQKGPILCHRNY